MSARWTRRFEYVEIRAWRPVALRNKSHRDTRRELQSGEAAWWRRALTTWSKPRLRSAALGGSLGGLLGALTIVLSMVASRAVEAGDSWLPAKLFALPLMAHAETQPWFDASTVLTGLLVLSLAGAALGAGFGALVHSLRAELTVPAGAAFGFALWTVASLLLWPTLPAAWQTLASALLPAWGAALLFVLFGVAMGVGSMVPLLPRDLRDGDEAASHR